MFAAGALPEACEAYLKRAAACYEKAAAANGAAVEQMKQGAVDFLQKPVSARPLQTALERALVVSEQAVARQQIITCYRALTAKERELAGFVVNGLMNREIAQVMNIAVRTVEVHRARVMEKMQAANLAALVNKWQQLKETHIVE